MIHGRACPLFKKKYMEPNNGYMGYFEPVKPQTYANFVKLSKIKSGKLKKVPWSLKNFKAMQESCLRKHFEMPQRARKCIQTRSRLLSSIFVTTSEIVLSLGANDRSNVLHALID